MAEQDDIRLRMTLDASGVESGVEQVEQSVEQLGPAANAAGEQAAAGLDEIGSAAQSAESKVEQLGQESKDAWSALSGLGDEGKAAAAAMSQLEASGDSPRTLLRNAALAEVEMKQLKASIDAAAASGKKFGPEVADAVAKAEAKIESAAKKSRELADATGDLKTRGDLAAKGFESAAGSAGSLEGMLGQLKDTSGPVGQSLADLGFKGVAVAAAFTMGYEAGGRINEFLEEHGNYLAKAIDATVLFVTGGTAEAEMLRALDGPVNKSLRDHQDLAKSAQQAATWAKAMGVSFKGSTDDITAFGNKSAALALALQTAQKAGQSFVGVVKANETSIRALVAEAGKLGIAFNDLPGYLKVAAQGLDAFSDAQKKIVTDLDATGRATAEFKAQMTAAFATGNLVEFSRKWADLIIAQVAGAEKGGQALATMSAGMQAAYKLATEAAGANRLAVEANAKAAITSYASIEVARKTATASAQKESADAVAAFDAKMKALNAASVSEEEYSARKQAAYAAMAAALAAATAKEMEAAATSKNAQAALQASLVLTPEKFGDVAKAAGLYADAISKGATPTEATRLAVEGLGTGFAKAASEMGKADFGPPGKGIKLLGDEAGLAAMKIADVAKATASLSNLDAMTGKVNALATAFRNLAAASAAASGKGGGGGANGADFVGPPNPSGEAG